MLKYTRIYDKTYNKQLIGYKLEGYSYSIYKDIRTNWNGNEIVDGYEVINGESFLDGERIFYASTLKEAKEYLAKLISQSL